MLDQHPTKAQEKEEREVFTCPVNGCAHESKTKGNRIPHFLRNHCGDTIQKNELTVKTQRGQVVSYVQLSLRIGLPLFIIWRIVL